MPCRYFNRAAENLEIYVQRYEDDGKTTLNHLASTHQVTIAKDTEKKHGTCGCDVKDGQLRILFGDKCLGFNTSDATEVDRLGKAVNDAEAAGGASALNLDARNSISKEYDTEIGETQEKARKSLNLPTLKFAPDFEHNFAELTKIGDKASRDWAKSLGSTSLSYYNGFVDQLERQKFVGDDMLQEGFAESVSKGEVGLRIVPKLVKGSYNEVVIDDGVCYIQTTPDNWACNTNDAAEGLLDLL